MTRPATVIKVWQDANDRLHLRPAELVVILNANGKPVREVTLNADNKWTYTINDLPVADEDGKTISYTWTEPAIKQYKKLDDVVDGTTTTLTNRGPGGDILIPDIEPPLGLGQVFINVGDCLE